MPPNRSLSTVYHKKLSSFCQRKRNPHIALQNLSKHIFLPMEEFLINSSIMIHHLTDVKYLICQPLFYISVVLKPMRTRTPTLLADKLLQFQQSSFCEGVILPLYFKLHIYVSYTVTFLLFFSTNFWRSLHLKSTSCN